MWIYMSTGNLMEVDKDEKIFISQPMRGLTDVEIKRNRQSVIDKLSAFMRGEEFEVIDSFLKKRHMMPSPYGFWGNLWSYYQMQTM